MALAGGLLTSERAAAGNSVHPRTPVLWPEAPCVRTVDRSLSPELEFSYEIPQEDTLLTPDELDDSRRHQFVALCRQYAAGRPPPLYVSTYDLERAIDSGFEDAELLADPEATLETSELWAGCWVRVTPDDARRPITFEAAAEPVVWDTSAVEAGTWLLLGYTWEPPYNIWRRAPWVVRVVDDPPLPDPPQAAATIADTVDGFDHDASIELELCVDAVAGSTLTLEWANSKSDPLEWMSLEQVELGEQSTLSLPFVPPETSWGQTALLRAHVEQALGPGYQAHGLAPVVIYAGSSGDGDGDGDGDSDGDETAEGGETGSAETSSSETSGGPSSADEGGVRCSLTRPRGGLTPIGLGLLALSTLVSQRRRHRHTGLT